MSHRGILFAVVASLLQFNKWVFTQTVTSSNDSSIFHNGSPFQIGATTTQPPLVSNRKGGNNLYIDLGQPSGTGVSSANTPCLIGQPSPFGSFPANQQSFLQGPPMGYPPALGQSGWLNSPTNQLSYLQRQPVGNIYQPGQSGWPNAVINQLAFLQSLSTRNSWPQIQLPGYPVPLLQNGWPNSPLNQAVFFQRQPNGNPSPVGQREWPSSSTNQVPAVSEKQSTLSQTVSSPSLFPIYEKIFLSRPGELSQTRLVLNPQVASHRSTALPQQEPPILVQQSELSDGSNPLVMQNPHSRIVQGLNGLPIQPTPFPLALHQRQLLSRNPVVLFGCKFPNVPIGSSKGVCYPFM